MKAPWIGKRLAIGVLASLAPLLLPAVAPAQSAAAEASEPPPGITVRGIGFARVGPVAHAGSEARKRAIGFANTTAAARAVGDARLRAKEIARRFGVKAGRPTGVVLRNESFFGVRRHCRNPAEKDRSRCRQANLTAATASVTFAIVGDPEDAADTARIDVRGAALEAVEPADPKRSQSIKRAVLAARRAATSEAAAIAHRNAMTGAESARLELGRVVSVSETAPAFPFGEVFVRDDAIGSFGPALFCGFSMRPVVRRDPKTGRPHVVRRIRRYGCRIPRDYSVSLDARYAAG